MEIKLFYISLWNNKWKIAISFHRTVCWTEFYRSRHAAENKYEKLEHSCTQLFYLIALINRTFFFLLQIIQITCS